MFVENIVKSTKDNGIQKVFVLIFKKKKTERKILTQWRRNSKKWERVDVGNLTHQTISK